MIGFLNFLYRFFYFLIADPLDNQNNFRTLKIDLIEQLARNTTSNDIPSLIELSV